MEIKYVLVHTFIIEKQQILRFTYIGVIDKIKSRGNQTIIKNGKEIQCEYYIFKTKNIISKGLSMYPNQLVPKIKEGYCRYV